MKGALNMKHKIFVLGLILSCLLGLTACGSEINYNSVEGSRYDPDTFTTDNIKRNVDLIENELFELLYLNDLAPEDFEEKLYFGLADMYGEEGFDVLNVQILLIDYCKESL